MPDLKSATFAAGCFWGVEDAFSKLPGVTDTEVGYTGGDESYEHVTYEMVSSGKTGHAESVKVTYDSSIIKYEDLLEAFWSLHDPTQLNRQGYDVGSQYRSAIFYHDSEQKKAASGSIDRLEHRIGPNKKVVTEIRPAGRFYRAEEYHQQYVKKKGRQCHI